MHIEYIELSNVKSYEDSGRINFAKGINAIGGQTGAGKSTIVEAVGFALFDARTHTTENFIREGCKKGQIIVGFVDALDERLYEVVRVIPGIPYIYDPEIKRKLVIGKDDVYSWIKEHLQVSSAGDLKALFQDTVGVQQGLLTAPFQQNPSERKVKFDKLLQVEEYDDVYKWLAISEKELDRLISDESVTRANLKGKLSDLPSLQKEGKSFAKEIKKTSGELDKKGIELMEVRSKKLNLDNTKVRIDKLSTSIETQDERILDLKTQLNEATTELIGAEKAQEVVSSSFDSYQAFKDCEDKLIVLENQCIERDKQKRLEEKIERGNSENEINIKAVQKDMQDIEQAAAEINRLTPIRKEFLENQANLKGAEEKDIHRKNTIKRLENENERLNLLRGDLERIQKDLLERTNIESKKSDLDKEFNALNNDRASEGAHKNLIEVQIEQLKDRKAVLAETDTAECPVCLSPLDPDKITELESHFSDEILLLEQELTTSIIKHKIYDGDLRKIEANRAGLERRLKQLPSLTREAEVTADIEKQKKVVSECEKEKNIYIGLDELIVQLRTKKNEFGDIESQFAIHQNTAKKRVLVEENLASLLKSRNQFQIDKKKIEVTLQAYVDLDETKRKTTLDKNNFRTGYDLYVRNIKTAEQYKQIAERIVKIQSQIDEKTEVNRITLEKFNELQGSYDMKEHDRVNDLFVQLNKNHGALEERKKMLEKQQLEANNKLILLLPLEKDLKFHENELNKLNSVSAVLTFLRKTIREAGPHIVKQLLQAISEQADQIFGEILNDYTARLKWTDDYEITIEHQGFTREFSQLSGGEKMTAALAVRLALLREMSELRIAFFDEPTANLDDERRNNLAEQMKKIKGFDQLFVISHDDTFEHQTDHVLHVYKENGTSYVTGG